MPMARAYSGTWNQPTRGFRCLSIVSVFWPAHWNYGGPWLRSALATRPGFSATWATLAMCGQSAGGKAAEPCTIVATQFISASFGRLSQVEAVRDGPYAALLRDQGFDVLGRGFAEHSDRCCSPATVARRWRRRHAVGRQWKFS